MVSKAHETFHLPMIFICFPWWLGMFIKELVLKCFAVFNIPYNYHENNNWYYLFLATFKNSLCQEKCIDQNEKKNMPQKYKQSKIKLIHCLYSNDLLCSYLLQPNLIIKCTWLSSTICGTISLCISCLKTNSKWIKTWTSKTNEQQVLPRSANCLRCKSTLSC